MSTQMFFPGLVKLDELREFCRSENDIEISRSCEESVELAAAVVAQVLKGDAPVYGVNTGFGKLSSVKIAAADTRLLQRNLILSHCSGVGDSTPGNVIRLMMLLKLLSLARGASGVRWTLIESLEALLNKHIMPVIPAQGSVGASGDLAPLAHMAAVMIGEGEAEFEGRIMPAENALVLAGIKPVELEAKEGLALINGTQFSCAYALVGLFDAINLAEVATVTSALATDAIMGSTAPLRPEIHALRGHQGQIDVAAAIRHLMAGSAIRESHRDGDTRVQDPYCIRCQPQVTGACVDLLRQVGKTLQIEANAITDNPLIICESHEILSGGNFHAEPVAFAADQIALAVAEMGAIAQRRVALLVDPALSFDLPPFLTPEPGLNSGYMIAEVTSAALMSENKHLATPCSTDSTPTSANQEDHVSMSAHGARRLERMNQNLTHILAIELLCAAQGIFFRAPLLTSSTLQDVIRELRLVVPELQSDRYLATEIALAASLIRSGSIVRATGMQQIISFES